MPKPPRGSWLLRWNDERLLAFIDYIEAQGGVLVDKRLEDIANDLGWPVSGTYARKKWAHTYGIIRVKPQGRPGKQRAADRLELVMSPAEWREKGNDIVEDIRAAHVMRARQLREATKPKKPKKLPKAKPRHPVTPEDKVQARADAKETLAADPYPDFVVDELSDDEVEAWAALGD